MTTDTTILTENPGPYNSPTPTHTGFNELRALAGAAGLPIARCIGPGEALIPSRTLIGVVYYVYLFSATEAFCTCPAPGHCWHEDRARQLTSPASPVAAPLVLREAPAPVSVGYVALGGLPVGTAFEDAAHRRGIVGDPAGKTGRRIHVTWASGLGDQVAPNYLVRVLAADGTAPRWLPAATTQARAALAQDDLFDRPRKVA